MKLLVIRHAIAEDRDEWARTGAADDDRPLTDEGRAKMAKAAGGLRSIISRIDLLATSPLVRARETAAIVQAEFGVEEIETTAALVPTCPFEKFSAWLGAHTDVEMVAVVGHEPHLSELVTWFLAGTRESRIELKKGAACLLDFTRKPKAGVAQLQWLLQPSQLRRL